MGASGKLFIVYIKDAAHVSRGWQLNTINPDLHPRIIKRSPRIRKLNEDGNSLATAVLKTIGEFGPAEPGNIHQAWGDNAHVHVVQL